MKALIFDGNLKLREDYPEPVRQPGEALLEVLVAGICKTDLEIAKGYMGFTGVLGHEFVGVVIESDDDNLVGGRMVGEINCPCGQCMLCQQGLGTHCPHRTVLGIQGRDGSFAEKVCLPEANLHSLPREVSDEDAVFVEPLAAAYEILEQTRIRPEHRVAVLGDGRLGLLTAQVLATVRRTADDLLLVGHHISKLRIASELGIETCLANVCSDTSFDYVVDCTGSHRGFLHSLQMVRPRGTIVLKSTFAAEERLNLAPVVIKEITIIGSRCGPFGRAIRALRTGEVSVKPLISKRFPLEKGIEAMKAAAKPENIKVLLDITGKVRDP